MSQTTQEMRVISVTTSSDFCHRATLAIMRTYACEQALRMRMKRAVADRVLALGRGTEAGIILDPWCVANKSQEEAT